MSKCKTNYNRLSRIYDFLDILNYGNISRKSRNAYLTSLPLKPNNPLVIACGTGDFTVSFIKASNPAQITINDLSHSMLETTLNKINNTDWQGNIKIISTDILETDIKGKYDYISINYLLSMFSIQQRIKMLEKCASLLDKDGIIQISDFDRPANPLLLLFFYLNWWAAVIFFWIFSNTSPNLLGKPENIFKSCGLTVIRKKIFLGGLYSAVLLKNSK